MYFAVVVVPFACVCVVKTCVACDTFKRCQKRRQGTSQRYMVFRRDGQKVKEKRQWYHADDTRSKAKQMKRRERNTWSRMKMFNLNMIQNIYFFCIAFSLWRSRVRHPYTIVERDTMSGDGGERESMISTYVHIEANTNRILIIHRKTSRTFEKNRKNNPNCG